MSVITKTCTSPDCEHIDSNGNKIPQPLDSFYDDKKSGKYGKRAICKDCVKRYNKSPKAKASLKKWRQSPKGKAVKKKDDRKYLETENGRRVKLAQVKRFQKTEKGQAIIRRVRQTPAYKAAVKAGKKRYEQTPYGKAKTTDRRRKRYLLEAQVPGFHTYEQWKALCIQFDYRCVKCGEKFPFEELTRDHIIPITLPGCTDYISNIQPMCRPCNSGKGNKSTVDYRGQEIWWQQLPLL